MGDANDGTLPEGNGTDVVSAQGPSTLDPSAAATDQPLPEGDGPKAEEEPRSGPPPAVFEHSGSLMVSVQMSAQGHAPSLGRYYVRGRDPRGDGGEFVVLSTENSLAGWDATAPGLMPDNADQVDVVCLAATVDGQTVLDASQRPCVIDGKLLRLMLSCAAREAMARSIKPRVRCAGRVIDLRAISTMLGFIDDNTPVTIVAASVPIDESREMPFVRFESGPATAILFCDLWDALNNPANSSEIIGSVFSVEGFVAANSTAPHPSRGMVN